MTEPPHPMDYNATLDRMEVGIAPVDPMISLASIAISMRALLPEVIGLRTDLADLRYAINTHGNQFQGTSGVIHALGSKLDHLTVLTDLKIQLEKIVKGLEHGKSPDH